MSERVSIELEDFSWTRLRAEAAQQGVSVEELVKHAVLYSLADVDSGRIARRIPREGSSEAEEHRQG